MNGYWRKKIPRFDLDERTKKMFVDITGKKRLKAGLHTHTTVSDGRVSPKEAIRRYAEAGYDILAFTDHWKYGECKEVEGLKIISGCEYHTEWLNEKTGVYEIFHIVGFDMDYDPMVEYDSQANINEQVRSIVRQIRAAGGVAVLAHPLWSMNAPDQILEAGDFDALEIYNSVSESAYADRPYSGPIVDMLATKGVYYPLLATDDTHYYTGEEFRGMVMLEADAVETLGLAGAIRAQRFYATQGPEIHLERISQDEIRVLTSPAIKIAFFSNLPWARDRVLRGEGLTEAIYTISHDRRERFVRAEVTDEHGRMAWSNIIQIR